MVLSLLCSLPVLEVLGGEEKMIFELFSLLCLQSLCFLVRDWSYPDEYGYGSKGGKAYLEEVLQVVMK